MIDSSTFAQHFVVGATAAAAFEVLKVYELRTKLSSKSYLRLIRSPLFWLATLGMVLASGFFAWVFYANSQDVTAMELALSGVAARSFVREGLTATTSRPVKLGDEQPSPLRDMFS